MTASEIRSQLEKNHVTLDTFSVVKGVVTIRHGYFYSHGYNSEKYKNSVLKAFPKAKIIDSGDVWKPFRGGASVANQSHWFVKFTIA